MRHRNKKKILDRKQDQRKALIKSLVNSLIINEKVITTKAKAGVARRLFEKIITISKKDTLAGQRRIGLYLTPESVQKLTSEINSRFKDRKGGYTRIIKMKKRKGDAAQVVLLELV